MAKCGEIEHGLRLNGLARTAHIKYEKQGADAADHVEHFLLNCGDDDLMDLIDRQRLDRIHRLKMIISHRLLGEKGRKQRDRLNTVHELSLPNR